MSAFDLLPSEYISRGWANCLHLIGKEEKENAAERSLSLWFQVQGFLVRSAHNNGQLPAADLPTINQWTTIVVDQIQNDGKHLFSVSIGGKEVLKETLKDAQESFCVSSPLKQVARQGRSSLEEVGERGDEKSALVAILFSQLSRLHFVRSARSLTC